MRLLLAAALVAVTLAGCTTDVEPDYTLVATGVPMDATAGEPFTFTMRADGAMDQGTDHLGAHYWHQSVADGMATEKIGDAAGCEHTEGDLPGTWDVTCTMMAPGVYYLRGHARVHQMHGGEHDHDFWGEEHMVRVHPAADQYTLSVSGAPANATSGEAFTFTLDITGGPTVSTDHIGAHHWLAAEDTGDIADAGACDHQAGDVPGRFTVSCTLDAGEHVVRGHMRITVGEQKHDFWAEAFTVSVA